MYYSAYEPPFISAFTRRLEAEKVPAWSASSILRLRAPHLATPSPFNHKLKVRQLECLAGVQSRRGFLRRPLHTTSAFRRGPPRLSPQHPPRLRFSRSIELSGQVPSMIAADRHADGAHRSGYSS